MAKCQIKNLNIFSLYLHYFIYFLKYKFHFYRREKKNQIIKIQFSIKIYKVFQISPPKIVATFERFFG